MSSYGLDSSTLENIVSQSFSSVMSSFCSYSIAIIFLVLEAVILAKVHIPKYGLRFVPIYGEYYFYQSLAPEKKTLNIWHIVLVIVKTVFGALSFGLAFYYLATVIFSVRHESDALGVFLAFMVVLCVCAAIADFVIVIILKMNLAERFDYESALGILFGFIPIVGTICFLVHVDKYR